MNRGGSQDIWISEDPLYITSYKIPYGDLHHVFRIFCCNHYPFPFICHESMRMLETSIAIYTQCIMLYFFIHKTLRTCKSDSNISEMFG